MTNKNNRGWTAMNEGMYDPAEDALRRQEADEKYGFGRLTDDTIPVLGGLRSKLDEMVRDGNSDVLAVMEENGIDDSRVPRTIYLATGQAAKIHGDVDGWHVVAVIDGQELVFTNPDRDTCMAQASAYADRNHEPRDLSRSERLHIARLAQAKNIKEALIEYLKCRLGNADLDSPEADVRYQHIYNSAAFEVWMFAENSYVRNPQFEQLIWQVAEEKPLTYAIIRDLYRAYCTQKPSARPSAETPEAEPTITETDLERLSDAEVAKLRQATLNERGRRIRAFDSTMVVR